MHFVNCLNASSACLVAADWAGHPLQLGGTPFLTRRGQLSSIDLRQEETNYNLTVAATSGSGKSFASAELVTDFLSRGGIVRMIDVGESYKRLCDILGGSELTFDINDPKSINPFYGVWKLEEAEEMVPIWVDLVEMMAFQKEPATSWIHAQLDTHIMQTWHNNIGVMELKDIYEHLLNTGDERLVMVAQQLAPFAVGRHAKWFNGKPDVTFDNPFCILELGGLESDEGLRTVILALVISMIAKDMFQHKSADGTIVPKMCGVDEAWALLSKKAERASRFIETMARRVRKVGGSLVTITQSYEDYDLSDASRAAWPTLPGGCL